MLTPHDEVISPFLEGYLDGLCFREALYRKMVDKADSTGIITIAKAAVSLEIKLALMEASKNRCDDL